MFQRDQEIQVKKATIPKIYKQILIQGMSGNNYVVFFWSSVFPWNASQLFLKDFLKFP